MAKVLVIETDARLRDCIEKHLTEAGFVVRAAVDPQELAEEMQAKPDIFLIDLDDQEIAGVELAVRLRQERKTEVALIAYTRVPRKPTEAGLFDAVLLKPLVVGALASLLTPCQARLADTAKPS